MSLLYTPSVDKRWGAGGQLPGQRGKAKSREEGGHLRALCFWSRGQVRVRSVRNQGRSLSCLYGTRGAGGGRAVRRRTRSNPWATCGTANKDEARRDEEGEGLDVRTVGGECLQALVERHNPHDCDDVGDHLCREACQRAASVHRAPAGVWEVRRAGHAPADGPLDPVGDAVVDLAARLRLRAGDCALVCAPLRCLLSRPTRPWPSAPASAGASRLPCLSDEGLRVTLRFRCRALDALLGGVGIDIPPACDEPGCGIPARICSKAGPAGAAARLARPDSCQPP